VLTFDEADVVVELVAAPVVEFVLVPVVEVSLDAVCRIAPVKQTEYQ
jgi:hypothetical protein